MHRDADAFGDAVERAWFADYSASTPADPGDLVVVHENGFRYLFDLAGSLGREPRPWPPRVVGVWGRTRPGTRRRDRARMKGHPRPGRAGDDRGHLVACAAGGGADINLVPMDADLNRGRSPDGARFRDLERRAVAVPGTVYFVRLRYVDDTDRARWLEVGIAGDEVVVAVLGNATGGGPSTAGQALRRSAAMPLHRRVVEACLDAGDPLDGLFLRAWRSGPASLSPRERCAVAGVTGHVAESVVEVLLDGLGWRVLWHHVGPGRHGVDLVLLSPDGKVVAVEVKGTLVRGRIPRLSRREVAQMSSAWVDGRGNPGMVELGMGSADVHGAVVVVDVAGLTWRVALTADFESFQPVADADRLRELSWLA